MSVAVAQPAAELLTTAAVAAGVLDPWCGKSSLAPAGRPTRPRQQRGVRGQQRDHAEQAAQPQQCTSKLSVSPAGGLVHSRSMSAGRRNPSRSRGPARGRSRGANVPCGGATPTYCSGITAAGAAAAAAAAAAVEASIAQPEEPAVEKDEDLPTIPFLDEASELIGSILDEVVDEYADNFAQALCSDEAPLVLPAFEPPIPEEREQEAAAEAEAAEEVARRQACSEANSEVAAALTLSVLLEAAADLGSYHVAAVPTEDEEPEEDKVSVVSYATGNADNEAREDIVQRMSSGIIWGSSAAEAEEVASEVLAQSSGTLPCDAGVEQIRDKLRLALEDALEDGSLEQLLMEFKDSSNAASNATTAVEESWPDASKLSPCSRRAFKRRKCPRMKGAPVPEEPFPMDCLPMSAPVARTMPPAAEIAALARLEYGKEEIQHQATPFFLSGPRQALPLSDEAEELLLRTAANAAEQLERRAREEASTTLQRWYRHLRSHQQQKQVEDTSAHALRAPAPPTSSKSGGGSGCLGGRRRFLGLHASPPERPETAPPPPAAAPDAAPKVPMAPAAPRTLRPVPRPALVSRGDTARPEKMPSAPAAGDERHDQQPTLMPQPPSTPRKPVISAASAGASPRRSCRSVRTETSAAPSAMELDLGIRTASPAPTGVAAQLPLPPVMDSPRTFSKATGTSFLPALPTGNPSAASVSWSVGASTPRGRRPKSIDAVAQRLRDSQTV